MLRFFRRGLWANPDFVSLWAGTTVAQFGTFVGSLAILYTAILWLDASAVEVAILSGCQIVPAFLIGPIAGVWVDRLPRRPILVATDVGRAIALTTIPVAALFDVLTIPHVWAAGAVLATLSVFFDTAYRAYLPALVGRAELLEGNSKLAASSSVAEIGGFGISGFLVQAFTAPGAVLVNAAGFAWSAIWIRRIHTPEPPGVAIEDRTSVWRESIEGASFVFRDGILRSLAGATIILNFGGRIISVVFLLYLAGEIGWKPGALGLFFAVGGVTSIFGALVANRSWGGGLGPTMVGSVLIRALGAVCMPLTTSVSAVGGGLLVANQLTDPAWMYYEINEVTIRQSVTPDRLLGRMNATMRTLEGAAMILGTAAGGILGELIGLRETLFVAVATIASAAIWLSLTPVGRLKRTPTPVTE